MVRQYYKLRTKVVKFKFPLQSDLTGILADEIIKTGSCDLTDYSVSEKIHRDYIYILTKSSPSEDGRFSELDI